MRVATAGRYLVDSAGQPFRCHGEASWDAHINLSRADWRAYLADRKAKRINALFTYFSNPVAYANGSSAPWLSSLGGSGAGAAALPFLKNISGGTWNGDPTFANHDASFANPNDAYYAQVLAFFQDAEAYGMAIFAGLCYLGFGSGAADGWYQTLSNTGNTQTVCNTFGQYLANGSTVFAGFKTLSNLVLFVGGDTFPAVSSEAAARVKQMLQGFQSAGGTQQLVTSHWQHDYLSADQTDLSSLLTVWHSYTHAVPESTMASTAAMVRQSYSNATTQPVVLLETYYWGDHGATRHDLRLFGWHAAISSPGGYIQGYTPLWTWVTSADGTTDGAITGSTAWQGSKAYTLNQYASHQTGGGSGWYLATTAGTSAASGGPTGTGTGITDGSVVWSFVGAVSGNLGGYANIMNAPAVLDHQVMGNLFATIPWWLLVPSGLGSMGTIITSGGGTAPVYTDGSSGNASGGLDYVASAADPGGTVLLAYCPNANGGTFSVDMTKMRGTTTAWWLDPTTGNSTAISSSLANTGTHSFTTPGTNAGGDSDWVLVLRA